MNKNLPNKGQFNIPLCIRCNQSRLSRDHQTKLSEKIQLPVSISWIMIEKKKLLAQEPDPTKWTKSAKLKVNSSLLSFWNRCHKKELTIRESSETLLAHWILWEANQLITCYWIRGSWMEWVAMWIETKLITNIEY